MTVPIVKSKIEVKRADLLPKTSDKADIRGWTTAWARRYEVPIQYVERAEVFNAVAIVCSELVSRWQQNVISDIVLPEVLGQES